MDHAALTVQLLGLVELPEIPDGFDSGEVVRDATTEIERLTRIDPGDTE